MTWTTVNPFLHLQVVLKTLIGALTAITNDPYSVRIIFMLILMYFMYLCCKPRIILSMLSKVKLKEQKINQKVNLL